jgi:hypothetical protein
MSSKTLNKYVDGIKVKETSKSSSESSSKSSPYNTIDDANPLPANITHENYHNFDNRIERHASERHALERHRTRRHIDTKNKKYKNLDEETKRYIKENYFLPADFPELNFNLHYTFFRKNVFYKTIRNNLIKIISILTNPRIAAYSGLKYNILNKKINDFFDFYDDIYMNINNILNFFIGLFQFLTSRSYAKDLFDNNFFNKEVYHNDYFHMLNAINILLTYTFNKILKNTFIPHIDYLRENINKKRIIFFKATPDFQIFDDDFEYMLVLNEYYGRNLMLRRFYDQNINTHILYAFNIKIFDYKILLHPLRSYTDEDKILTISDLFKHVIKKTYDYFNTKKLTSSNRISISANTARKPTKF